MRKTNSELMLGESLRSACTPFEATRVPQVAVSTGLGLASHGLARGKSSPGHIESSAAWDAAAARSTYLQVQFFLWSHRALL